MEGKSRIDFGYVGSDVPGLLSLGLKGEKYVPSKPDPFTPHSSRSSGLLLLRREKGSATIGKDDEYGAMLERMPQGIIKDK